MTAAWAACGASVTGSLHQLRGLGCDDAYSFGVVGDFVVAAVADGAGSVSGTSAWGAHVACQSVLDDAMRPTFIDQYRSASPDDAAALVRLLFASALERVQRQAAAMGVDVLLLSTTLCVALASRDQATFGQIGDGVIATEGNGSIDTLLIERKAEYANTTSFLQSERALDESFRTVTLRGVTAFALSTDGMSYKITNVATGEPYEPFFRGCWQHLRSGASTDQFAALLGGIEDDQTGDDKTMVLAVVCQDAGGTVSPRVTVDASPPPAGNTRAVDGLDHARRRTQSIATADIEAATVPFSTGAPLRRRWRWGRQRT
ncbi:PP2C family serine/threonine-protein phosphatase [Mycolicibacterium sp.]|uniref:PP2C family serine/threonine-protein phosphatase n=1 Tax=Mycolicibacterium sp. TaxID=2320850 RepID=UPI0037C99E0C